MHLLKRIQYSFILILTVILLNGCAVVKATGQIAQLAGSVVMATGYVAGKAIEASGKIISTIVSIPGGKKKIQLSKIGNSLFVNAVINRRVKARLLLDTGATDTQISAALAKRLGIKKNTGRGIMVRIAGGYAVAARSVLIKEINVGGVRVCNLQAIVLSSEIKRSYDGLLGMSYLNNFKFSIDTDRAELTLERPGN